MSRHQRRFDTKQVICTIIGGVFGVGLIFLIGIHVGKQVGGAEAIQFQTSSHEVPTGAVASATNQVEPDYHFFELLEAPAPQRDLQEVELPLNPVLEEREKKKEERLQKARDRRKKAREKKAENPKADNKEADNKEADNKKADNKKADNKRADNKEPKAQDKPREELTTKNETQAAKGGESASETVTAQADEPVAEPAAGEEATAARGTASPASVAIAAEKEASAKPTTAKRARKYTVQVSAFPEEDAARKLAAQLAGKGYKSRVTAEEVPGKGTWYRVRVGAYTSRDDADSAKRNIKSKAGLSGFVTVL